MGLSTAEKEKRVYKCPRCEKRVFDAQDGGNAVITIKCPKCKTVVDLTVQTIGAAVGVKTSR